MEDKSLLMIVLAFILGCMCSQMMISMCDGRLVEGEELEELDNCDKIKPNYKEKSNYFIIAMDNEYMNAHRENAKSNMNNNINKVQEYYDCNVNRVMNENNECILEPLGYYTDKYGKDFPNSAYDIDFENMKKINRYLDCIGIDIPYPDIAYSKFN